MKKKVVFTMAAIMLLGALSVRAEQNDDISHMITMGKIDAAEAQMQLGESEQFVDNAEGKWAAAEDQMKVDRNFAVIESQIKELRVLKGLVKVELKDNVARLMNEAIAEYAKLKSARNLAKSEQFKFELEAILSALRSAN